MDQSSTDEYARAEHSARFIQSRTELRPRIAVVLGSGLSGVADMVHAPEIFPFASIPHFPRATATGHLGNLLLGTIEDIPVAVMQGRVHLYEGYSGREVAFPVRVLGCLGARALLLTNSAGAINTECKKGEVAVVRDHINLQGSNPLTGLNDDRFGVRHPDMTNAYNPRLRQIAVEELLSLGDSAPEGVYAAVSGPSFETPAEIRFLRALGADLVGMSTVAEVIAARHMRMQVLAISCVTNIAAGITGGKITEEEVTETGHRVQGKVAVLLRGVLPKVSQYIDQRP